MVKYCSKCGTKILDEEEFCPNCGEKAVDIHDANRKNPFMNQKEPKPVNNTLKSSKWIIMLIVLALIILTGIIVFSHNSDSHLMNSGERYNISYKGIYLSGKGVVEKSTLDVNETPYDGVSYDEMDFYNVTLNNGEYYTICLCEMKIENFSNIPADNLWYQDVGHAYSIPLMLNHTDYYEVQDGKNITYAYCVCIYSASHYKYVTTEFLESIVYPQEI